MHAYVNTLFTLLLFEHLRKYRLTGVVSGTEICTWKEDYFQSSHPTGNSVSVYIHTDAF